MISRSAGSRMMIINDVAGPWRPIWNIFSGGFGQGPWLESHGGSTYCAVAALSLLGGLDRLPSSKRQGLVRWCINRQITGFQVIFFMCGATSSDIFFPIDIAVCVLSDHRSTEHLFLQGLEIKFPFPLAIFLQFDNSWINFDTYWTFSNKIL